MPSLQECVCRIARLKLAFDLITERRHFGKQLLAHRLQFETRWDRHRSSPQVQTGENASRRRHTIAIFAHRLVNELPAWNIKSVSSLWLRPIPSPSILATNPSYSSPTSEASPLVPVGRGRTRASVPASEVGRTHGDRIRRSESPGDCGI